MLIVASEATNGEIMDKDNRHWQNTSSDLNDLYKKEQKELKLASKKVEWSNESN